jgi:hypothetical protein
LDQDKFQKLRIKFEAMYLHFDFSFCTPNACQVAGHTTNPLVKDVQLSPRQLIRVKTFSNIKPLVQLKSKKLNEWHL